MAETVDKQKDTGTTDLEHSFPVPTLIQLVMDDNIFIVMASAPAMTTANSIVLSGIIAHAHMVCN